MTLSFSGHPAWSEGSLEILQSLCSFRMTVCAALLAMTADYIAKNAPKLYYKVRRIVRSQDAD